MTVESPSALMHVARVGLDLFDSLTGVLEELHLRQVRGQRIGRGSHGRDRRMACLLGSVARLLGGVT